MVNTGDLVKLATARLRYLGKLKLVTIDNWAFSIHYRLTAIVLLLMSLFITCNQFFGKPISCIKNNDIRMQIIEQYCWIQGTFTLPRALIRDIELEEQGVVPLKAHPGIDHRHKDDDIVVHNYYYWVCFRKKGLCFLVTRVLWKVWEKGYMKLLIEGLNKAILDKDKRYKRSIAVTDFLNKRRFDLQSYAKRFFYCEILNLLNVILQIYITDVFLHGQFIRYGWDMMFAKSREADPTNKVFPKLGKCSFRRFGASGDVQTYDNLCLLPINIVNEKFYLVIWILFFVVLAISLWAVFIRIMLMLFKDLRFSYIQTYNKHIDEKYFESVFSNSSYAYWFILYLLSCNLEPMHFRDVILAIDHFKEKQAYPEDLIAWNLPLKKKLQNGYGKQTSFEKDEKRPGGLIVQIPVKEDDVTDNADGLEVIDKNISAVSTLERN